MEEHTVLQSFTSVLFPFRYHAEQYPDESFNPPVVKRSGKEGRLWLPDPLKSYHLKENVSNYLGLGVLRGSIGQVYCLDDGFRRELDLPGARDELSFHHRGCDDPDVLRLQGVRLYLFTTGVGFLELTMDGLGADADRINDVNYFLCEVKSDANYFTWQRRLGKDQAETVRFSVLEAVRRLTASLEDVEDFDAAEGLHYVDNKPLLFSYLLFQRFPADLGRKMFNLRTNFKGSYQMPAEQYDLRTAAGVYHPFDNVYWGLSLNAVVCCASLTGDESADTFFRTTFPGNLRQTYLLLDLLRQHQRYAIQDMQRIYIADCDELTEAKGEAIRAAYDRIHSLQRQAISFRLKCLFRDPTTVEHINDFDAFLARHLHINDSIREFEENVVQLDAAADGLRAKLERQEAAEKKKAERRRERFIYGITAVWSTIVCFNSAWGVAEQLAGRNIWFDSPWVILPFALSALPLTQLIHQQRKTRREQQKEDAASSEKA